MFLSLQMQYILDQQSSSSGPLSTIVGECVCMHSPIHASGWLTQPHLERGGHTRLQLTQMKLCVCMHKHVCPLHKTFPPPPRKAINLERLGNVITSFYILQEALLLLNILNILLLLRVNLGGKLLKAFMAIYLHAIEPNNDVLKLFFQLTQV